MGDEAPAVIDQVPVDDPATAADTADATEPVASQVSAADALRQETAKIHSSIERRLVGLAQSLVGATSLAGSPGADKVLDAAKACTNAVQNDTDAVGFEARCLTLIAALEEAIAATPAPAPTASSQVDVPPMAEPAKPAPSSAAVVPAALLKPKPRPKLPQPKEYQLLDGRPKFGEGRESLPGGGYYEGQFRHFKRDGEGFLIMDEEGTEKYEGQFKDEFMHGYGRRQWKDGAVYEGQWAHGRKDGEGKFEEKGRCYEGQWKDGKRHGKGTQVFDKYTRYEGRWQNGMQHGTGKYYSEEDGSIFEGTWHNGAHNGTGILHNKDGSKERLQYLHGTLQSRQPKPPPTTYLPPGKVVVGSA